MFGIYGNPKAAALTVDGNYMQQHRGQEASGIVTLDNGQFFVHKGIGLVREIFSKEILTGLPGQIAIGSNLYSTNNAGGDENIQPFIIESKKSIKIAGCIDGDLPFYEELRQCLKDEFDYDLVSNHPGEAVVALVAMYLDQGNDELTAIKKTMEKFKGGACSGVFIINGALWAVRDAFGFRPLALGRLGEAYVIVSETCAFDIMGASYIRDVEPGQIVRINQEGERSFSGQASEETAFCGFEYIYFARPDSMVFGHPVSVIRKKIGAKLWELYPVEADLVISIPDSANQHAIGLAHASDIRYDEGLIRSHYVGREFIEPDQDKREDVQKYKHNPVRGILRGKRVIVVDDSIVRGTASRKLVRMLRIAGAKEIHMRIGSPRIYYPCFFGVDTPTRKELAANIWPDQEDFRQYIEADSVEHIPLEALYDCLPGGGRRYCSACFTGEYSCAERIPPEKLKLKK